jgi:serine/threonine-protein kinase RsbW
VPSDGAFSVVARQTLEATMRTATPDGSVEFVIPSDLTEARRIQDHIEKHLQQSQFHDKEIFGIRLALEEAIVNAIKHGNQMDPGKKVQVRYRILVDRFEASITDEGPGYNPTDLPDPCAEENLERPSGRGLFLIKHYMTDVVIHPPGNRLAMSKMRNGNGRRAQVKSKK